MDGPPPPPFSLFLSVYMSLRLSQYCPTVHDSAKMSSLSSDVVAVCPDISKTTQTRFSLLHFFFVLRRQSGAQAGLKSDLRGQVVIDRPLRSKRLSLPVEDRCGQQTESDREALALPDLRQKQTGAVRKRSV